MGALAHVFAAELDGIVGRRIDVETDVQRGLPSFTIVGLADKALSESKERINVALSNIGVKAPAKENRKVVVNLAPADVKKTGSQYDVAIAIGYLRASGQLAAFPTKEYLFFGELGLDGTLRAVAGAMSAARLAVELGIPFLVVPSANAAEAALIPGVSVIGAASLPDLIAHLEGRKTIAIQPQTTIDFSLPADHIHIGDIKGQEQAKRALTIAAAGNHNILFIGPPGTGKTMLAQALVSLLPPPDIHETIEITQIYSAAGMLGGKSYIGHRPFRSPHQTASSVSVFGGGQMPRPGEISLAHRGVLFLDELPEFRRDVLEALRQPLESGQANVSRVRGNLTFPARFLLVAAVNPCPCGYYGDEQKACVCSPYDVSRYQKKVSGPLLDRIDMQVVVPRITFNELRSKRDVIAGGAHEEVAAARTRQRQRLAKSGLRVNSELPSKDVEKHIQMDDGAEAALQQMFKKSLISPRGFYRVLKLAQTIADLAGRQRVSRGDIAEAFSYRLREAQPTE